MTSFLSYICLFGSFLCNYVTCSDILGCGGYVKSDVEIDFSQVGIKLLTRQGNLKYETDCAPNNGYYFIPLYDKGEYVLKVSPPSGWSFDPKVVQLKVDGETDPCFLGHDINFHFEGFAVVGKVVSRDSASGPAGVQVSLHQRDRVVMNTVTTGGGSYVFTPLASGVYSVVAQHPTWTLLQDKVTVEVTDKNGDAGSSLIVDGYSLSGKVSTDTKPTKGVAFVLHSKVKPEKITGCTIGSPEGYPSDGVLCHVVSNIQGQFNFHGLAPGDYTLVPYYQSTVTRYEVVPAVVKVTMGHDDATLPDTFKIEGFSVRGQVLMSEGGVALAGASVQLDNSLTVTTNSQGEYIFHSVKSGSHKISIKADGAQFDTAIVKVSAESPVVSPMVPRQYKVCFVVALDKTTDLNQPWEVEVTSEDKHDKYSKKATKDTDRCFFLPRGSYTAHVVLPANADEAGIRFGPREHIFSITSKPLGNLVFSQFLGEILGEVKCLESCPELSISLKPVRGGSGGTRNTVTSGGQFTFKEVVPGAYQITLHKDDWCWDQKSVIVTVNTQDESIAMTQTGYRLTLAAMHKTQLNYNTPAGKPGVLEVQKGTTKECIPDPGEYIFHPIGCHKFSSSPIQWSTKSPNLISLTATHHLLTGAIQSKEEVNFSVQIMESISDEQITLGPLLPSKLDSTLYTFEHWVKDGEAITLTPRSEGELHQFEPASFTMTMPNDCVENAVEFVAERALFIYGKVIPDLPGVTIKVTGGNDTHIFTTDAKGNYVAGPLDNSVKYSIAAEMKGYVLKELSDEGSFEAFKLAEIVVTVNGEAGETLPGVLVSVSGGKSYRQNRLTESDGTIAFQALMPSEYFLRPIMKEYTFNPPSKMVTVEEGATIEVTISGSRVAYSVFGQTVSLSGEHESDVTVEAVGIGSSSCSQYQEEAVSDSHGYFRIRGLVPKCDYELRLKKGSGINQHVERSVPESRRVTILEDDIRDLRMVVLRPFPQMDVAVLVDTDLQFLNSLVARVYRDDVPDSPLHTVKLGLHPYFLFPPMIADRRTYSFQLQSTLPKSQYDYNSPEVSFVADGPFKHLSLSFQPELRSLEAEMNQGTVVGLVVAMLFLIVALNYNKLAPAMERLADVYASITAPRSSTQNSLFDTPLIEPIKKKVKSRKI